MKIYRQSVFKVRSVLTRLLPLGVSSLMVWLFVQHIPLPLIMIWGGFLILFIGLLGTTYFYILLTENRLVIKNRMFPFLKKEFLFAEISAVKIGNTGGLTPNYIRIFSGRKKTGRMAIDLVHSNLYRCLIQDLQAKGISVHLRGVELK